MRRFMAHMSLRTKLFLAALAITSVAILIIGVYALIRGQVVTDFVNSQLLSAVQQKAEQQVTAAAASEALQVDGFLNSVAEQIAAGTRYMGNLFDHETVLGQGTYWNANTALKKFAAGQLGNSKQDVGSVLIPSRSPLTDRLAAELNTAVYLDYFAPGILKENTNIVAVYYVNPDGATLYHPNIDLANVVGDYDPSTKPYYTNATPDKDPEHKTIWTAPYLDSAGTGLIVTISHPVYDSQGKFRGILAADVQLAKTTAQIANVKIGQSGYAMLIDQAGHIIGLPPAAYQDFGISLDQVPATDRAKLSVLNQGTPDLQGLTARMVKGETGLDILTIRDQQRYAAFTPVTVANYSLGVIVPVDEMNAEVLATTASVATQNQATVVGAILIFGGVFLAAAAILFAASRTLTRPLAQLTTTAQEIASGNLEAKALVTTMDEIGTLGLTFNAMTDRLRDLIDSLETRVEMRTAQVQASADVGRAATSILDPDQLLQQVVQLITERFGFYYAAAFTLDPAGQWAMLREASGPSNAAWLLKQAGHRLALTGNSMVAACIRDRRARVAQDTGAETVRFANPLLPDTHSEVALPLLVSDQILGVLDVQSTQIAAFDETSTAVLQNMADQIAVALNNAAQYRVAQTRAQQTSTLLEASLELTAQTDRAQVNSLIVQLAMSLFNCDGVGVWLPIGNDEIELQFTVNVGTTDMTGRRLRKGEGLTGQVFETGTALRINDYPTWSERSTVFADAPFHAALCVPLLVHGQTSGVLALTHSQPGRTFTLDDENTAQLFAAQAATVIENTRLLAQVQTTLDELSQANKRLTGEAWQKRLRDRSISYEHQSTRSREFTQPALSMAVPIELRGQTIGQVVVEDDKPQRQLSADEQALVEEVVQRMALALESARLFEETQSALGEAQRLAQRERLINRITAQLRGAVTVGEVLHIAADEMRQSVGAAYTAVKLTPPTQDHGEPGGDHERQ